MGIFQGIIVSLLPDMKSTLTPVRREKLDKLQILNDKLEDMEKKEGICKNNDWQDQQILNGILEVISNDVIYYNTSLEIQWANRAAENRANVGFGELAGKQSEDPTMLENVLRTKRCESRNNVYYHPIFRLDGKLEGILEVTQVS